MFTLIDELKDEGITYVAPWRPAPPSPNDVASGTNRPIEIIVSQSDTGSGNAAGASSTTDMEAVTSSDFGSMSLDEPHSLERTSMCRIMCIN